MEDLGLIEWTARESVSRCPIYPYRLPEKASAVIVKYRPNISVSCVIPPQKLTASYRMGLGRARTQEVTSPILLMTQNLLEVPRFGSEYGVTEGFNLWALKLVDGQLSKTRSMMTTPYTFGNVWEKGLICFGRMKPDSLHRAFNYYWASGFNSELYHQGGYHECNSKVHQYPPEHTGCRCTKKIQHSCSCSRKTFHSHLGCGCKTVGLSNKCKGRCLAKLIENHPRLQNLYNILLLTLSIKGIPPGGIPFSTPREGYLSRTDVEASPEVHALCSHWLNAVQSYHNEIKGLPASMFGLSGEFKAAACSCCFAIQLRMRQAKKQARTEGRSLGPRQLSKLATMEDEDYPGCGCSWRHKNTCLCKRNRCDCPCICDCCQKTCDHGPCSCPCCTNRCSCPCSCTTPEKFQQHLSLYHEKGLPSQDWKDRTALICGEAYWAAPTSSKAILVTTHPTLLSKIPKESHRKVDGHYSCVIALGKENNDEWEFSSGTYKFRIPSDLVRMAV